MNAMVVDDSRAMRMILTRLLTSQGFEVRQAATGNEGLALLRELNYRISLILVDWNMPGISGLDFVRHIRSDPASSSIALIMVTTETAVAHMVEALDAGANEYIMKPFTPEILTDKLRLLGLAE